MPEGPSIIILKEQAAAFVGKKVIRASGDSKKIDFKRLQGLKITALKTWGKNFFICFPKFSVRIHLMMFGSYRINERKDRPARLSLQCEKGQELNFYTCVVEVIEEPLDKIYDWTSDVMNPRWDASKALSKLQEIPGTMICDALLNQQIFTGVGNIIKNEILFRTKIHPESLVGKIPVKKLKELIKEAVAYSFEFLKWKQEFTLKQHWLAHNKKICPRDAVEFIKAYVGKTKRRSFFCPVCQRLYR